MDKPKQPSLPGSGLLRVGGILLIVFGALGVALGPLSIVGGMTLSSPEMAAFLPAGQGDALAGAAVRSGGVMAATSLLSLVGGILAVRLREKANRRGLCVAVSLVLMLSQLAGETVLALYGEFDLLSAAIRLVFPLLLFAGAVQPLPRAAGSFIRAGFPENAAPDGAPVPDPAAVGAALPGVVETESAAADAPPEEIVKNKGNTA